MKYKIEELKDITDSREIMQSTPNGFSKYMMYIILAIIIAIIIWASLATKEITIKAQGVVRPLGEITKISSSANGNVTTTNLKEGMIVKKGDTLLVVNGDEYELQKQSLEESLKSKNKELDANKKLKDSILDSKNYLNQSDEFESSYYKRYEIYLDNIKSGNTQVDAVETQKDAINKTISDLNLLLKSIDEEKNYFEESNYLYYQYKDYEITLNNYKMQIEDSKKVINELENKKNELKDQKDPDTGTPIDNTAQIEALDNQIKDTNKSIDNISNEIVKYKNNQKLNIANTIAQNEAKLKESIASSNNGSYKEQYLAQIDGTISSLESSITDIKMNLELANNKLEATTIKAEEDGIINIINDVKQGDFIQAGTQIASIIPSSNSKYKAEVYIDNQNFGDISEKENVILEFVALPQREYGTVKTKLINISVDAKVSEKEGKSFYTGICEIPVTYMTNKKGNKIDIKNGMLVQARIINREVSYLRYFLEKINILD